MDLSKFDSRARAEEGIFVGLKDPYTGEEITHKDGNPGFRVRGTASRSVQSRMAEMSRAAKEAAEKAESDEEARAVMEAMHENLIDQAEKFIISGVNMEIDGKEVGTDPERIRKILDMTFPDMKVVKDENDKPVMTTAKGKDGKEVEIPTFKLVNKTWAQQVIEAAEDGQAFLGKPQSA
jgi:RNA binding exosome subunit